MCLNCELVTIMYIYSFVEKLSVQGKWCNTCGRDGSRQDNTDNSVPCGTDEHAWSLRPVSVVGSIVDSGDVDARVSSVGAADQRH